MIHRTMLLIILTLSTSVSCEKYNPQSGDEGATVRVDTDGVWDGERWLLLRGINARVQGLFDVSFDDGRESLEPIPPFSRDDCTLLASLGLNFLRLPVNWSGIEPRKGEYDQEYLDQIAKLVSACNDSGVYTLVDLHQDAYSKHIGEDGAPLWAIVPAPEELLEGPLTDLSERRISRQVLQAFGSLFTNRDGLRDAFAEMAAVLNNRLAGTPGYLGLEIFNEPVLLVGADADDLDQFHRAVMDKVREAHPEPGRSGRSVLSR